MDKQQVLEFALRELMDSRTTREGYQAKQVKIERAVAFVRLAEAMDGNVRYIRKDS